MAKEKYEGGSWQTATGAAIGRALAEHHAQPSLESQLAALREENAGLAAQVEQARNLLRPIHDRFDEDFILGIVAGMLPRIKEFLSTTPSAALAEHDAKELEKAVVWLESDGKNLFGCSKALREYIALKTREHTKEASK